jgi:hypothetical protein
LQGASGDATITNINGSLISQTNGARSPQSVESDDQGVAVSATFVASSTVSQSGFDM